MEKTDYLRNFECGIVDGSKHARQSISETADLLGHISLRFTENGWKNPVTTWKNYEERDLMSAVTFRCQ